MLRITSKVIPHRQTRGHSIAAQAVPTRMHGAVGTRAVRTAGPRKLKVTAAGAACTPAGLAAADLAVAVAVVAAFDASTPLLLAEHGLEE